MATIDQIQIPSGTYDMSVKDEYILWGGPNKVSSYGCIDAALVGDLRGNRLACIPGSAITVEYSRDAGSTWIDYGMTNAQKGAIFAQGGIAVIGKADSTNKATANGNKYQLRITINTPTAQLYTQLLKTVIYCSTTGSNNCKCQIQGVLRGSSAFTNITDAIDISGWSGYNVINHNFIAGNNYNGQYNKVRYLFTANGGDTNYNGLQILRIMSFGGVGWTCPSTIARTDHLYTYDQDQNANFPGKVLATGGFTGDLAGNATTATTATKLGASTIGGTTTPIYLNAGVPTPLAYTIAKSVPSDAKFTDTTYSSQAAVSGGTAVSLVTTGEKYTWNNKSNLAIGTTATTAAAGNHTHATSLAADSGASSISLAANTKYKLTAGGTSVIFTTPTDNNDTFVFTLDNVPAASLNTAGTDITQYSSATVTEIKAALDAGKFIVCDVIIANSPDRYRLSLGYRQALSTFMDVSFLVFTDAATLQNYSISIDSIGKTIKSRKWANPCSISVATSTGINQLTLSASKKYELKIGESSYIFTTPPNTTYSSKAAVSGGTALSLVTTGEKYTWNNKLGSSDLFTQASSDIDSNMPAHSYYYNTSSGELKIKLDPSDIDDTSRLWITMYTSDDSAVSFEASISLIDQDTSGGSYVIASSLWVPVWDSICKSSVNKSVFVDFSNIHTLSSYIRHLISSSNPLSSLKDYYDDMGGSFYIYVTK